MALGITSPWFVASSQFDAVKRRLDIKLDFKAGGRFDCPEWSYRRILGDGLWIQAAAWG